MSLALIFPGQGSQYVGMATALVRAEPAAASVLNSADEILGFPLSRLMADGPLEDLTATMNAQPALLTHSVAVLRTIEERLGPVSFAAGHSLGEFSAHVAAGTISFEDALVAVRLRGELMFEAGKTRPGTMAAVLGLDDDAVEGVCAEVGEGVCVAANFNAPGQVVVSGDLRGVEQGMELARTAGANKVILLSVSGAFHSSLMEPALDGLRSHLEGISFQDPDYPVVSNVSADLVTNGDQARELLIEQLTSPVRWSASIATMLSAGADRFMELGPGKVLCSLNRRNAKGFPCSALGEPSHFEALEN